MTNEFPLQVGDTGVAAQMSPCVGGLVRTWTDSGESHRWACPDAEWLLEVQATGTIGRTLQEDRRFREAALLSAGSSSLILQPRFPEKADGDDVQISARALQLEPGGEPTETTVEDFRDLLTRAIEHCVSSGEILVRPFQEQPRHQ